MNTTFSDPEELAPNLAASTVNVTAKSWTGAAPGDDLTGSEAWRVLDGDLSTFRPLVLSAGRPTDLGVEFDREIPVSGVEFAARYECDTPYPADGFKVQTWQGAAWTDVAVQPEKIKKPGCHVCWRCRFPAISTTRVRLVFEADHDTLLILQHLNVEAEALDAAGVIGLLWRPGGDNPDRLPKCALNDRRMDSALATRALDAVGYEWPQPVTLNGLVARFVHFGFGVSEMVPHPSTLCLETWRDGVWHPVLFTSAIDVSQRDAWAPHVHGGCIGISMGFQPIETRRLRIRFTGPRHRTALADLSCHCSERFPAYQEHVFHAAATGTTDGTAARVLDLGRDYTVAGGGQNNVIAEDNDLAALANVDPNIAVLQSFAAGVTMRDDPALLRLVDGNPDTFWTPAESADLPADFGIQWLEPRMVGKIVVIYRAGEGKRYEPAMDGFELQYWDGRTWCRVDDETDLDDSTLDKGFVTWTHTFFPTAASRFRIVVSAMDDSCADQDHVQVLGLRMFEDATKPHKEWMEEVHPDPVGRWIRHGDHEPEFKDVATRFLSPVMRAVVGFRNLDMMGCTPRLSESAVTWEGTVLHPWLAAMAPIPFGWVYAKFCHTNWFIGFAFGKNARHLQEIDNTGVAKSLIDGWLPGVEYRHHRDGIVYRQTVLACEIKGKGREEKVANFIRVRAENTNPHPAHTKVVAVMGWHHSYPNRPLSHPCQHDAGARRLLDLKGNLLLGYSEGGIFADGWEKTLTYEFDLAPGESREVFLVQPLFPCRDSDADELTTVSFEDALTRFRGAWQELLAAGTRIETPEPRMNDTLRATQAQLLLGEHGGIVVDGFWPSHYYRTVWVFEDAWYVTVCAWLGYHELAKSAFEFIIRITNDNTGENHLRHGVCPLTFARLCRVMRDEAWCRKVLPEACKSVDWVRGQRRENSEGKHRGTGLMPRHKYGGDIHDVLFPLTGNVLCWRSMRDTALVLKELGEDIRAETYMEEAADYRQALLTHLRSQKFTRQKPTAVPLRTLWKRPYPFTHTHYTAIMPSVLEANILTLKEEVECAEFLEAHGRLFCGVQNILSGSILGRGNKIDYMAIVESQYNIGYQMAYLKNDDIEKYILGVYGLMVINLDRDNFTAAESNELGVTEADRMWYQKAMARHRGNTWVEAGNPNTYPLVVFHYLVRNMLVFEDISEEGGLETGILWLCKAAPRSWFAHGERLSVNRAHTSYGVISFRVESKVETNDIHAEIDGSDLDKERLKEIRLRLRHPAKAEMREAASVDGTATVSAEAQGEYVSITPTNGRIRITARYA